MFSWFLLFFKSVIIQLWIKKARVSTPVSCGNWNLISRRKREGKKKPLKLIMNISSQKLMTKNLLPLFGPGKKNIKMSLQSSSRLALYLSRVLEKGKKRNQEMTILWGCFISVIPVWGHFTSMWQSRIQMQGLSD